MEVTLQADNFKTSGVNDADSDDTNAPIEYFNLHGIRVEGPYSVNLHSETRDKSRQGIYKKIVTDAERKILSLKITKNKVLRVVH